MGNEDVRREEQKELKGVNGMAEQERRIYFTEDEKIRGWNYVDLDEYGDFYGEYVLPDKRTMFGFWYPTKWVIRRSKDPVIRKLTIKDAPYWASLIYRAEIKEEEEEIRKDPYAVASDFLAFKWYDWTLTLEMEDKEEQDEEVKCKDRIIEFTEQERLKGENKIDLGEQGDFVAEYIIPDDREVYGYWTPTEEAIEELREDGELTGDDEGPFWARISYIPFERDEELENELLKDIEAEASEFLELGWEYWDVVIVNSKK